MKILFMSFIFVLGGLTAHAADMSNNPYCDKQQNNGRADVQTPKLNNERTVAAALSTAQDRRGKETPIRGIKEE